MELVDLQLVVDVRLVDEHVDVELARRVPGAREVSREEAVGRQVVELRLHDERLEHEAVGRLVVVLDLVAVALSRHADAVLEVDAQLVESGVLLTQYSLLSTVDILLLNAE